MNQEHVEELRWVQDLMVQEGCDSYLEIGVRAAVSLIMLGETVNQGGKIVCVDLPGACWGGEMQNTAAARAKLEDFERRKQIMWAQIDDDSQRPEVVEEIEKLGPFDFVFLDADHTYDGVANDFSNYIPMATKAVILDDINNEETIKHKGKGYTSGVKKFWTELKETGAYATSEFVASGSKQGKGVVWIE